METQLKPLELLVDNPAPIRANELTEIDDPIEQGPRDEQDEPMRVDLSTEKQLPNRVNRVTESELPRFSSLEDEIGPPNIDFELTVSDDPVLMAFVADNVSETRMN